MDVVLHRLLSRLGGSLEQGSHIHIEATVCVARGYHFSTTVVPVLTHLGNHDTRLTTFFLCKFGGEGLCLDKPIIVLSS